MISTKTKWVPFNAWRGHEVPVHAVAGANDTGMFPDSPCPSNTASDELGKVRKALRVAGIRFRETSCESSNIFMIGRFIVVADADLERGRQIVRECLDDTQLLYVVE